VIGGQFANVSSAITPQVSPCFRHYGVVDPAPTHTLTGGDLWPLATLDIEDVTIGGGRPHLASERRQPLRRPDRTIDVNTGNVDTSFRPQFDGISSTSAPPANVSTSPANFLYVNNVFSIGIGVLDTGALVPASNVGSPASPAPAAATGHRGSRRGFVDSNATGRPAAGTA
jgi:hypothetical protein